MTMSSKNQQLYTSILVWNDTRVLFRVVDAPHHSSRVIAAVRDMQHELGVTMKDDDPRWQTWPGVSTVSVLPRVDAWKASSCSVIASSGVRVEVSA